jgi:hypothetical protein
LKASYSYLKASIGSSFEALYAGTIPDTTPTNILMKIENNDSLRGKVDGKT